MAWGSTSRPPLPPTPPSLHLSITGATIAGLSGLLLGLGYSLLNDEEGVEKKGGNFGRTVARKTLGGGVMTLGLYLFSPNWIRQIWNGRLQ